MYFVMNEVSKQYRKKPNIRGMTKLREKMYDPIKALEL